MTNKAIPQVDHLLLLVGGNPLPNAVAGKLLVRPGGTISLIYSEQILLVKDRLDAWLSRADPPPTIRPKKVGEADPYTIYHGVKSELKQVNATSVSLHYTGGTKAMSTHAYQAAKRWASERDQVTFIASYLDSHTLKMVFDPADLESGQSAETQYVGLAHSFTLQDFLDLHGWKLLCPPIEEAILPSVTRALVDIHLSDTAVKQWKEWSNKQELVKWQGNVQKWQPLPLPLDPAAYSELAPLALALKEELSLPGSELAPNSGSHLFLSCLDKKKQDGSIETLEELFCKWLKSGWLENYVLQVLKASARNLHVYQSVETVAPQFEVDVVAVHGYQLFLFSCATITTGRRQELKLKLLEASVRAAQLGGDEARVALICCAEDPKGLQNEMRLELESNRIRVFGREHLADLGSYLARWIRAESKEG